MLNQSGFVEHLKTILQEMLHTLNLKNIDELAQFLGYSKNKINHLINGKNLPDAEFLEKIKHKIPAFDLNRLFEYSFLPALKPQEKQILMSEMLKKRIDYLEQENRELNRVLDFYKTELDYYARLLKNAKFEKRGNV